jgi:hypothetical protein
VSVLAPAEIHQTADWIATVQLKDGMVPWYEGGHADPWNHVEATMALAAGGRWAEVQRAFEWLASKQLPDGSWCAAHVPDGVIEPRRDPNTCAYVATGAWWCAQLSGDTSILAATWPMIERAMAWCLRYQRPGGEVTWSVDPDGVASRFALLTASSSLQHSLACAARVAAALDHQQEAGTWTAAAARMADAVAARPESFVPKTRWAMDWYYPVLTGAVVGAHATRRVRSRWAELVVDGLGIRCVADKVWVTAAETAECAMAAARAGLGGEAHELLAWTRHLRADDGGYWTGCVHPDCVRFPAGQKSTYSAAAVILADHVLNRRSLAAATFSSGTFSDGTLSDGTFSDVTLSDGALSDGTFSDATLSDGALSDGAGHEAGNSRAPTPASSSLAARRPEPMHAGTPTPL